MVRNQAQKIMVGRLRQKKQALIMVADVEKSKKKKINKNLKKRKKKAGNKKRTGSDND